MAEEEKYSGMPMTFKPSDGTDESANLVKLLTKYGDMLNLLRREFRGEVLYQDKTGDSTWIQMTKPIFVLKDFTTGKELKRRNGFIIDKEDYIPNDEAIDEILSEIKFMGVNVVTPITRIDENEIVEDLKEFEIKLAKMLCSKQEIWGLDRGTMPMLLTKIKTIVKDARYVCNNGNLLMAIMKSVQRIEQSIEQPKKPSYELKGRTLY